MGRAGSRKRGEQGWVRWAASLGELCGRAGAGADPEQTFLEAWVELHGGCVGVLVLRSGEDPPSCFVAGPDVAASDRAVQHLDAHGGGGALVRLPGDCPGCAALFDPPMGSLLRFAVHGEPDRALLLVGWSPGSAHTPPSELALQVEALGDVLARALTRLASREPAAADVAARRAWADSNVPLILLREDGEVLSANAAAGRKLGIEGDDADLPPWLRAEVELRLQVVRSRTEPTPGSGEYAYAVPPHDERLHRIGLARLDPGEAGLAAGWLLSVEKGGPTLFERVELAARQFRLTPRETEVLDFLTRGLSNRSIAEVMGLSEATIKFHLVSIMRKSGTGSRTELLSTIYSLHRL